MFVCLLLAASDTTRESDSAKISASIDRIEEYFSDEGLSALKPYLDYILNYIEDIAAREYVERIFRYIEISSEFGC